MLLISTLWPRQGVFESKGDKLSSFGECKIRTRVSGAQSPADWMPADKLTELSRIKLKKRELNRPSLWLSGEPDYFGRNKISSGGDLSHYSSASLY